MQCVASIASANPQRVHPRGGSGVRARSLVVGGRRGPSAPNATLASAAGSNTADPRFALLFDCDGVIVETGASGRVCMVRACSAVRCIPGVGVIHYYVCALHLFMPGADKAPQ